MSDVRKDCLEFLSGNIVLIASQSEKINTKKKVFSGEIEP